MELNTIIKNYRKTHNLTVQEFAERCKLSKGYISMLENGKHPRNGKKITPSIETVSRIAKGMRITTDELVSELDSAQIIELVDQKLNMLPKKQGRGRTYILPSHISEVAENKVGYMENSPSKELFEAVKDATPDEINQAIAYINFLKGQRK